MLNENIKHFRKAKGISQEEMAVKLNVVRQTISKWENGLSVPDADVLIHMAELLDVSVSSLLGIETDSSDNLNLSEKLERLNEQLAKKNSEILPRLVLVNAEHDSWAFSEDEIENSEELREKLRNCYHRLPNISYMYGHKKL